MFSFSLLFLGLVVGQLVPEQHTALMTFYDEIGCENATVCPRFLADAACPAGPNLGCSRGSVSLLLITVPLNGSCEQKN
jgi:hypothetical protein